MEENYTCLYCSHETYLDRVYMQQSKSKKHIYYVWHDTSINQIKCICQEHNHFVNEGSLEGVNEGLLKGMRDYEGKLGITGGNEGLLEGMRDY